MLTWTSGIVNGIVFIFSIWFSHVSDFSQWWHWLVVIIAAILVVVITTVERREAQRYRHEEAREHQSMTQNVEAVQHAVNQMKDGQEREKVIEALEDYYEEIMRAVEGMQVSAGMRGVLGVNRLGGANIGWVPRRGPNVRDIIPTPQFGKPNDEVRPN